MELVKHHKDHTKDELLEMLWHLGEKGRLTVISLKETDPENIFGAALAELTAAGTVQIEGERISLTQKGQATARDIIRRHRLAERLINDVLGEKAKNPDLAACEFEHILAPELVDSICILLGHPRTCPHGKEIPEGACCRAAKDEIKSLVMPLTELKIGVVARVAGINTKDEPRMHKLLAMGITPGTTVKVHQKYPALVVEADQSQIALENAIAEEIVVWRPSEK